MNDTSASSEAILAPRHHAATIALHWVTLLLILFGLAAVFTRELFDEKPARAFLLAVHRNSGLLVLIMVGIRLLLRWPLGVGAVNNHLQKRLRIASALGHAALYLLLFALPLVGWLLSNAHGQAVQLLGVLPLPTLTERDRDFADQLSLIHVDLAWALLALAASHALAALWHHYRRGDAVLISMLPRKGRRSVATPP
jgi:cytochrome b561